jgi:hypothetical protein
MQSRATSGWTWLLRTYPADFRNEYGPELIAAFGERIREEPGTAY